MQVKQMNETARSEVDAKAKYSEIGNAPSGVVGGATEATETTELKEQNKRRASSGVPRSARAGSESGEILRM